MIIFGFLGYLFRKFEYEAAPLLLAFVLGPLLDLNLRHAMLISDGNFLDFFTRPISAITLSIAFLMLLSAALPAITKRLTRYKASAETL
jgi:putative tricarboxylic transport membrane protein